MNAWTAIDMEDCNNLTSKLYSYGTTMQPFNLVICHNISYSMFLIILNMQKWKMPSKSS